MRANISGLMDTLAWFAGILTTTWTVTALQGHNWPYKIAVVVAVSIANYVGSVSGMWIGKKYIKGVRE